MKCTIPEISWHNRDPVLSIDVQPIFDNDFYRLASGGTDSHVLIWHLKILHSGAMSVEAVCDLTRHQRAVNVVRWSPSGQYLASGDDDANIIIWQQKADELAMIIDGDTSDKEKWSILKILRGHKEDVYDISWSPNSLKLLSGSVDNTAIIWDLFKGTNDNILKDHKGFVQGVSWDPKQQYIATLSSDRTCRIFNETGKIVKFRTSKGHLNVHENHPFHGQLVRYYHDDTLKSFFRRLSFSPDGNILVTPAGHIDIGQLNKSVYTTYVYKIDSLTQPVAVLPSPGQYTIAVRFCPVLFELRSDMSEPFIVLPYRMVFAVATKSSVVLYDTQQITPFAVISNIHYTRLTDLTWSHDGRILAISSTDGFCSLVTFEPNELGTEYLKEESDEENMAIVVNETLNEHINEEKVEDKQESKRNSFLKQWAIKKEINDTSEDTSVNINNTEKENDANMILIDDTPPTKKLAIEKSYSKKSVGINVIQVKRKATIVEEGKQHQLESLSCSPSIISSITKPMLIKQNSIEQISVTNFFKSHESSKNTDTVCKNIINSSANIANSLLEDSVVQDISANKEKVKVEKIHEAEIITIEDSQDMKLILEETNCVDSQDQNIKNINFQKLEMINKDTQNISLDVNQLDEHDITNNKKQNNLTVNNPQGFTKTVNLDENMSEDNTDTTKEMCNKKNIDFELHTSKRKKVPFITLSSPRNKKKK